MFRHSIVNRLQFLTRSFLSRSAVAPKILARPVIFGFEVAAANANLAKSHNSPTTVASFALRTSRHSFLKVLKWLKHSGPALLGICARIPLAAKNVILSQPLPSFSVAAALSLSGRQVARSRSNERRS